MMSRSAWLAVALALVAGCGAPLQETVVPRSALRQGEIVMRVAAAQNADPFEAGRAAADALRTQMGAVPPQAVLVAECFDEKDLKVKVLEGICSVFPRKVVYGGATYGTFGQAGCLDSDSVALLGIGGRGVAVAAALERRLGTAKLSPDADKPEIERRLLAAGARLARKLPRIPHDQLLILIADAHSPKNEPLVQGVQKEMGANFPITGGCVNKHAGQTYVYYQGRMFEDSAIALLLSGHFKVALSGRQAKENAKVISTAKDAAAEAIKKLGTRPFAVLAFNCAGRKGKLKNIGDELAAMQEALGKDVPLFGCYCAGEIGPADLADKEPGVLSSGVGWHVIFVALGR